VLLQIMLPAAFLGLMCVYKHYLPPVYHPQLQQDAFDIDTKWWAGAVPYTGESAEAMQQQLQIGKSSCKQSARCCVCCKSVPKH
jgi:hypothetical protein